MMKRGIVKSTLVMLALAGFFLSTWTVNSTTLFQMQHQIIHSQANPDGSYTHRLRVELTNHSTVDLSGLKLTASTDPRQHAVLDNHPLQIRKLAAAETASLNWSVRSNAAAGDWQSTITFTGQADDQDQRPIALTIVSEARL